nr:DNA primase small subunit-like [Oncorhynchus nerka]
MMTTYFATPPSDKELHQEFSFTLKDDIYVRYQSFSTQSKLEKAMQKMNPYKIDIGAVYCHWHNTVKSGNFQALEKELVFDIDMTDYNDVRSFLHVLGSQPEVLQTSAQSTGL